MNIVRVNIVYLLVNSSSDRLITLEEKVQPHKVLEYMTVAEQVHLCHLICKGFLQPLKPG